MFRKKKDPSLHIFVRHAVYSEASAHKKRASYFSKEGCFNNLIQTMPKDARLSIVLDTYHGKEHFTKNMGYPVMEISEGSEAGSFLQLIDIALKDPRICEEDIIYFVEDDYLHRPDWADVLLSGFDLPVDYVTLYDHKDKYSEGYKELRSKIYLTDKSHFRETPSTTNTFAMKRKTLARDAAIHQEFSSGVKISLDHKKFCKLSEKGAILISALPGYSTHMEPEFESPCISWETLYKELYYDSSSSVTQKKFSTR